MKLIERNYYLQKLINVVGTPDIKIITGVRRAGKSKLLESFEQYLRDTYDDITIIKINYNLKEFRKLRSVEKLEDYVDKHTVPGKNTYLLIDEIQLCEDFEEAVNGFYETGNYDIYLTGSNAFLASSDLATFFVGRQYEIEVYPFSLKEYMRYYDLNDPETAFDSYFDEGGMSGAYLYGNKDDKYKYIYEIYETLIIRDIQQKYHIRNKAMLDQLVDFMLDNIANLSNSKSISDNLINKRIKTNNKTIGNYITYICRSFLFYKVRRYDLKGKRYLASDDKYYVCDPSFRYARLGTVNMDYGRTYENMVAIELLRRGYELYVGKLYQKEIDFVAKKRNEVLYIQVSDDISNPDTFEREVDLLLKIRNAYPKLLIARTKHPEYQHEGIRIIDLARWLADSEL
ncbi:MAG: ATP-binding protein [Erysipelotrichaceae bacterium]|nr:ATP-binding protein [Erysipelotrichaceae bacterium]